MGIVCKIGFIDWFEDMCHRKYDYDTAPLGWSNSCGLEHLLRNIERMFAIVKEN